MRQVPFHVAGVDRARLQLPGHRVEVGGMPVRDDLNAVVHSAPQVLEQVAVPASTRSFRTVPLATPAVRAAPRTPAPSTRQRRIRARFSADSRGWQCRNRQKGLT